MTTLRSEGRATLQWCLDQEPGFFVLECSAYFCVHEVSIRKQFKRLAELGVLQSTHVHKRLNAWEVINRHLAQELVEEKPKPYNGYIPVNQRSNRTRVEGKRKTMPVSFIFNMGA